MKYDAFVSYRHTEPDMYIAKKVHKGLETLKVPRGVIQKSGKKKIERVFRDQEELPIGSDLGDNIGAERSMCRMWRMAHFWQSLRRSLMTAVILSLQSAA